MFFQLAAKILARANVIIFTVIRALLLYITIINTAIIN